MKYLVLSPYNFIVFQSYQSYAFFQNEDGFSLSMSKYTQQVSFQTGTVVWICSYEWLLSQVCYALVGFYFLQTLGGLQIRTLWTTTNFIFFRSWIKTIFCCEFSNVCDLRTGVCTAQQYIGKCTTGCRSQKRKRPPYKVVPPLFPSLIHSRDSESNPVLPGSGAGGLLWWGRAVPVVEEGQAGTGAAQGCPP